MLDQVFEMSRKALESSLQMQQALFKHWTQDLSPASPGSPAAVGISADWGGAMRKRWGELTVDALNKHREWTDSNYRALIQALQKALRIMEARSSDDAARALEDVWNTILASIKAQSEAQFRELQAWLSKALDLARNADTPS